MIAMPLHWQEPAEDMSLPSEAAVERAEIDIAHDREKVAELLFDDGSELIDALNVVSYSVQAWPIIERMAAGLPVSEEQRSMFPNFFRSLKPWMLRCDVLIREAAVQHVQDEIDQAKYDMQYARDYD